MKNAKINSQEYDKEEGKTKRHKLGLCLSGGGAKGFAHLGVLQLLKEKGIVPDIISGTSAGALAGAFYADGYEPYEIADFFKTKKFQEFAQLSLSKVGFFNTAPFVNFLKENLRAKRFEDLAIPLHVIATNVERGIVKEFVKGEDLASAIVASCAIPIIFEPIQINNNHYVDGGVFKNFPVTNIRNECEIIIGVNVSPMRLSDYKHSMKYMIERTIHYVLSARTLMDCHACDFLIEASGLSRFSLFDLEHVDEIMEEGYLIANEYYKRNRKDIINALS